MTNSEKIRNERIIEALLFAAGEPVSLEQMSRVLDQETNEQAKEALESLREQYQEELRGMQIIKVGNGYQMTTRPDYYPFVSKLYRSSQKVTLSETQLETLAIIAYKQPITKQEIEDIRGVRSDAVVGRLMDYNLVTEKGRKKAPGRPILFGTTDEFLRTFHLESLKDLPYLQPSGPAQMELDLDPELPEQEEN